MDRKSLAGEIRDVLKQVDSLRDDLERLADVLMLGSLSRVEPSEELVDRVNGVAVYLSRLAKSLEQGRS